MRRWFIPFVAALALTSAQPVLAAQPQQGVVKTIAADNNPGFTGGRLIRVDPESGAVTELATGFGAPNAIARDHHGTLYVSDSFAVPCGTSMCGTVYTVSPT